MASSKEYLDFVLEQLSKLDEITYKGKETFYEKFGFKIRPNEDAGAGMDQWLTL